MTYILKKKWHPSQVEEVGYVFAEDSQHCFTYNYLVKDNGGEKFISSECLVPHEIALLVDAGYLEKQTEEPTLDLWTTEPETHEKYYYISDEGTIHIGSFQNTPYNQFRLRTNNCHKTQKSAEEALKRLLEK